MKRAVALVACLAFAGVLAIFAAPAPPCAVTQPVRAVPPRDSHADPFGDGPWYINKDRSIWAGKDAAGMRVGRNKVLWIRPSGTQLRVWGHRLECPGAPADGADSRRLQHGLPANGPDVSLRRMYWEIRATAGASAIRFVTEVAAGPAFE